MNEIMILFRKRPCKVQHHKEVKEIECKICRFALNFAAFSVKVSFWVKINEDWNGKKSAYVKITNKIVCWFCSNSKTVIYNLLPKWICCSCCEGKSSWNIQSNLPERQLQKSYHFQLKANIVFPLRHFSMVVVSWVETTPHIRPLLLLPFGGLSGQVLMAIYKLWMYCTNTALYLCWERGY